MRKDVTSDARPFHISSVGISQLVRYLHTLEDRPSPVNRDLVALVGLQQDGQMLVRFADEDRPTLGGILAALEGVVRETEHHPLVVWYVFLIALRSWLMFCVKAASTL